MKCCLSRLCAASARRRLRAGALGGAWLSCFLLLSPPTGTLLPLTSHTDVEVVTKLTADVLYQVHSIVEASFRLFPLVT